MNISEVVTKLSASDIKSIINDFVKVEGLTINNIEILDGQLKVQGSFKKILSLGFKAVVEIDGVKENKLNIKLKKASLMKIGILRPFRRIGLKLALKGFKERGIFILNDSLIIDIRKILEEVKLIKLVLKEAKITDNYIEVKVQDIDLLLGDIMGAKPEVVVEESVKLDEDVITEEEKEDYILNLNVEKKEDIYTQGREKVVEKIPSKVKGYSDIIMFLPDILALIARLFKDNRVPKKTKIALALSLGYTVLPIDIIPDKIPILGKIDEVALILFALNRIIEDVPIEVILSNWQGSTEFALILKNTVEYLVAFTGAKNLNKIYDVINALA